MYGNGYFKMFGDLYLVRGLGLLAISLFTILPRVALVYHLEAAIYKNKLAKRAICTSLGLSRSQVVQVFFRG